MRTTSIKALLSIACLILVTGCASVPMESAENDVKAKSFPEPDAGKSGLYVYRDSFVGKALKKDVYLDGNCIGETADKIYFYQQVEGNHTYKLSTESEFSPNDLVLDINAGKNYFVRQYIKMGVFVGGAGLESVSEEEGKRVVSKADVHLAKSPAHCDHASLKAADSASPQK